MNRLLDSILGCKGPSFGLLIYSWPPGTLHHVCLQVIPAAKGEGVGDIFSHSMTTGRGGVGGKEGTCQQSSHYC